MAIEIERKFLIKGSFMQYVKQSSRIVQGYLSHADGVTVRVRIRGEKGFITVKGPSESGGLSRNEFEYEIPVAEAETMLSFCTKGVIEKVRHLIPQGEHTWEVDVFAGENEGLVMAEIELKSENEPFSKPDWLGKEVTGIGRYYNSSLSTHPYNKWDMQEVKGLEEVKEKPKTTFLGPISANGRQKTVF